ncbi:MULTISPECIES: hypothetical protein [Streptomyces]|uniref:hypothetical protein n=1 Tax=Streptomyces TaxID=1883 RepID=UPI000CD57A29|nr:MULTISPECIES: hypothetical protein [Streptomyces]
MVIQFTNAGFENLHSATAKQREECERIWENVRSSLYELTEQGLVDEQIRGALLDRDTEFRRLATRFDEDVQSNSTAMRNVQNTGMEGGQAMVNVLRR